jgi:hypothetical protein
MSGVRLFRSGPSLALAYLRSRRSHTSISQKLRRSDNRVTDSADAFSYICRRTLSFHDVYRTIVRSYSHADKQTIAAALSACTDTGSFLSSPAMKSTNGRISGKVAALLDSSTVVPYAPNTTVTNATSLTNGVSNTALVIAIEGAPLAAYAAGLCTAPSGGFSDRYLPAPCEMGLDASCAVTMQNMQSSLVDNPVTGGAQNLYWTSAETVGSGGDNAVGTLSYDARCMAADTSDTSASACVLEKTRLRIFSVTQDNFADVSRIYPVASLALNEIHKCWRATAVDLSVRMCWAHRVRSCLLQSVSIQAKMVMDLTFAFKRVKFFPKDCTFA